MDRNDITISIIIPTHNRVEALLQTLHSLKTQTFPQSKFEVIVVTDGCTDDTVETVNSYQAPYQLSILEQESSGAAAARNNGASKATGTILLFLDDDIITSPQLVEAHAKAHQQNRSQVVIGYLPPIFKDQKGFFKTKLHLWWEDTFTPMYTIGFRFNFRNLLSGNFSIPAPLFLSTGGFDTSFQCQEDYEIGMRLIQADVQFVFVPEAMGYHNDLSDLKSWLHRKYSEGKAAVQFCRIYPQITDTLPVLNHLIKRTSSKSQRTLAFIANWPSLAAIKASLYHRALPITEWLRMRRSWEKLLGRLQTYWYIRGVLDSVGDVTALDDLLRDAYLNPSKPSVILHIDLKKGIVAAEQNLNELRPDSVTLHYGEHFIGHIAVKAGFERLRGIHLRPILAQEFARSLMQAIAFERLQQHNERSEVLSNL